MSEQPFDVEAFCRFYADVHTKPDDAKLREPFPWQRELVERVLADGWPDVIDVPTGLGKTSVLDVAVFALAASARAGGRRVAPLRTFFVIDRRIVVDDVYAHATSIRSALVAPGRSPVVASVADALVNLSGNDDPLQVVRLRGGTIGDSGWAARVDVPTIITTTIDQFGSRLLFRGYGVSSNQQPIHAALCGNDALVVVDEAHLAQPLHTTLAGVRQCQSSAVDDLGLPYQLVRMSATIKEPGLDRHTITEADHQHEVAQPRLKAKKMAMLEEVKQGGLEALAKSLAKRATELLDQPGVGVVGVVANRVGTARITFDLLSKLSGVDVVLLTGRIRPVDAELLRERYISSIQSGWRSPEERSRRLVVVATQTIEVGLDIDLDALVTEAAPLDSLLQRVGRVDRLGVRGSSQIHVLYSPSLDGRPTSTGKGDVIYGDATSSTWEVLTALDDSSEAIDLGYQGQRGLWSAADPEACLPLPPHAPALLSAHIDAWMRTSSPPAADPPTDPFLHGIGRTSSEVQIAWRSDLPNKDAAKDGPPRLGWLPRQGEMLSVPLVAAKRWLARVAGSMDFGDIPEARQATSDVNSNKLDVPIWRVVDRDHIEVVAHVRDIRPGDVILCPSVVGGCDSFGWCPDSTDPVSDLADLSVDHPRGLRLRLDRRVLASLPGVSPEEVTSWLMPLDDVDGAAETGALVLPDAEPIRSVLEAIAVIDTEPGSAKARLSQVANKMLESQWESRVENNAPVLVAPSPLQIIDNDTDVASFTQQVSLHVHGGEVGDLALKIAKRLKLPQQLIEAAVMAGEAHDLGKADHRFQCWLHGGNKYKAMAAIEPLAKSGVDPRSAVSKQAHQSSGLPEGFRHEALSVALLSEVLDGMPHGDLIAHLVGTHHGRGRATFPAMTGGSSAQEVSVQFKGAALRVAPRVYQQVLDDKWVEQFYVLNERYGPWGLALLEAVVRTADVECSRNPREGSNDA